MNGRSPGARVGATNDVGERILGGHRERLRRMQRGCERAKRGSRRRAKAYARLSRAQHRETKRNRAYRHKQVAIAVRKADVHVIETNRHLAMRRRGGTRKKGMNRALAEAAPASIVALFIHQCRKQGRTFLEVEARYGTRQCVHCASRDTRVTRENVVCRGCGMQTERDCNAAGNTVLKVLARSDDRAVAALRAHNREVTVRRGSVLGTWCAVARESLGLIERALASWGPRMAPHPRHTGSRADAR